MSDFKRFSTVLSLALCLVAINVGLFIWAWTSSYGISDEHGPIENIQLLTLGLTFAVYVLTFSKQEGAAQTLAAVFCILCVFLILKELDFKELKAAGPDIKPYWVENSIPERMRKLLMYFGPLLLIVFLIGRIRDVPSMVRAMISRAAWPYYLCLALLLLGEAVEHPPFRGAEGMTDAERLQALAEFHRSLAIGQFWEELIELNAYLVLFYAALNSAAISSLIVGRVMK